MAALWLTFKLFAWVVGYYVVYTGFTILTETVRHREKD